MNANDTQVGGSHYKDVSKGGEQHWDMMWRLYREAWFVGCITKYILRYRKKNGIEDLNKARHYLEKLIELERKELEVKTFQLSSYQDNLRIGSSQVKTNIEEIS